MYLAEYGNCTVMCVEIRRREGYPRLKLSKLQAQAHLALNLFRIADSGPLYKLRNFSL